MNFIEQKFNAVIESIGVYLPPKVVTSKEVLQGCKRKIRFPMERMTGIKSRRMGGETEFSVDLAKKAVENCLQNSKYNPENIDLLICCNISRCDGPNFCFSVEPATAVKLKKYFGFENALVFDITNACTGMWTGIYIADAFLKLGVIHSAMVVSGEYITALSRTAQKEIKGFMDQRLACLTLGDAGAAVTLERSTNPDVGIKKMEMFTLGKYSPFCIAKPSDLSNGPIMITELIKLSAVTLKYAMMLTEHVRKLSGWLPEDFNHFIMHQVSKISLDDARRQINKFYNKRICDEDNVINNLAERGNTASTSHIVAMKDFILNEKIKSGENLMFIVTGSGLTVGTAFYTLDDLPDRLNRLKSSEQKPKKVPWKKNQPATAFTSLPRIRIESIGTVKNPEEIKKNTIDLASVAAEDCLKKSSHDRSDIDLFLSSGVYRSDHIFEPAMGPLITGDLRINDTINSAEDKKTFAFDIFNGAVGFINACYIAARMIQVQKHKIAMIVASEVENNAKNYPDKLYGLEEIGSALILDALGDEKCGFGHFVFKYFTDYQDNLNVFIELGRDIPPYLDINRDPAIHDHFIDCIRIAVQELLSLAEMDISEITVVFPPQISSRFIKELSTRMGISKEKFVDVTNDGKDLFTSSIPYAIGHAIEHKLVKKGDAGLIIGAGSGIQVGCAIYYF